MEWHVGFHDFLHPVFEFSDHIRIDATFDFQLAIVAVRNGSINAQSRTGIQVAHGLVEHEEERTRVGAQTRLRSDVEKFHILVVEEHIVKAFDLVVDLGTGGTIGHVEVNHFVEFFEIIADGHTIGAAGILAADSDVLSHKV